MLEGNLQTWNGFEALCIKVHLKQNQERDWVDLFTHSWHPIYHFKLDITFEIPLSTYWDLSLPRPHNLKISYFSHPKVFAFEKNLEFENEQRSGTGEVKWIFLPLLFRLERKEKKFVSKFMYYSQVRL